MRTVLRMHAVLSAIRERFHEHCYDFIAAGNPFRHVPLSSSGRVTLLNEALCSSTLQTPKKTPPKMAGSFIEVLSGNYNPQMGIVKITPGSFFPLHLWRFESNETAELERLAFLEKMKGPINPTKAQAYFQPTPPTPEQLEAAAAEWERIERMKQPAPLPPPAPQPDFIQEQKQKLAEQRRREKWKGPIKES